MDLYPDTARLVDATENTLLLRLESSKGQDNDFQKILEEINKNLDTINLNCDTLQSKSNKVPLNRRQLERSKIEQLKFRVQTIKTSLRSAERRHKSDLERAQERSNLLNRRYTANDNQVELEVTTNAREARHNTKLLQSHNDIDQIIGQGQAIYDDLKKDSAMFKKTKTKMLSILNTMGLSNTLMRLIDKRTSQDRWLLYGMMLVSVLIMYCFWKYWS